jgi:hypothetical protein
MRNENKRKIGNEKATVGLSVENSLDTLDKFELRPNDVIFQHHNHVMTPSTPPKKNNRLSGNTKCPLKSDNPIEQNVWAWGKKELVLSTLRRFRAGIKWYGRRFLSISSLVLEALTVSRV